MIDEQWAPLEEVLRNATQCLRIGTLGPHGTSSDHTASHLRQEATRRGLEAPYVELFPSFATVLSALENGIIDLALVPSAYTGATDFHWSPHVRLLTHFVSRTPAYGLAYQQRPEATASCVSVASLPEVRRLYADLMRTSGNRPRPVWVDAPSTVSAAQMVAEGRAQLAITNDTGCADSALTWLARRDGADIVWMVFDPTPGVAVQR